MQPGWLRVASSSVGRIALLFALPASWPRSTTSAAPTSSSTFGSDAGSTLIAFGAWAAISGAIQLAVAIHRRRIQGRQLPMILSGGLSTVVGISFIASTGGDKANLSGLAGYMAFGAVLFLISAGRSRHTRRRA